MVIVSPPPPVHLERNAFVSEEVVKFWIAELACGLEYLHRQRIMHRCVPSYPDLV